MVCGRSPPPPPAPPPTGADLFISVWNLHHSPYLWKDPDTFRPERFEEVNTNPDFGGKWAGEGLMFWAWGKWGRKLAAWRQGMLSGSAHQGKRLLVDCTCKVPH